jgi:protocatechuate 3,4-dioxygenase beta subunit
VGAGGGSSTGMLVSPPWTMVPIQDSTNADMPKPLTCNTVTKKDGAGQGPFFIHELEKNDDISLIRQDIRGQYNPTAAKGFDMELYVRLIDKNKSDAACGMLVPVPDIEVYIWHTDAQGFYSGFGTRGGADEQKPDVAYNGTPNSMNLENTDRFCRGVQTTDANGVAAYLSTFPGWYNGRDLHIHIVCFKKGSMSHGRVDYSKSVEPDWIFTTQFYFDPSFSMMIHEANEPYKTRTKLAAYADAMKADEAGNSGRHCTATLVGNKVVAQIQMVVDPT